MLVKYVFEGVHDRGTRLTRSDGGNVALNTDWGGLLELTTARVSQLRILPGVRVPVRSALFRF